MNEGNGSAHPQRVTQAFGNTQKGTDAQEL